MTKVYVVTGLELGWDCVVAVYDAATVTLEELKEAYTPDSYIISTTEMERHLLMED